MQHKPSIDVIRFAIRVKICTKCWQRPPHSETLGPLVARTCEPHCTIFANLPQMQSAVSVAPAEMAADQVMHKFVCQSCHESATAGDFCAEGMTRTCPLSRYFSEVAQILEDIERTVSTGKRP